MTRVVSIPAVVVLPAPFGPSSPKISPACTLRSSAVDGGEVGRRRRPCVSADRADHLAAIAGRHAPCRAHPSVVGASSGRALAIAPNL